MRSAGQSRLPVKWWPNWHNVPCPALFSSALSGYHDRGFSVTFPQLQSKCKDTMRRQGIAHPPHLLPGMAAALQCLHHQWLPSCDYATIGSKPQQPSMTSILWLCHYWFKTPTATQSMTSTTSKKKLCYSWALVFSMPKSRSSTKTGNR